MKVRDILAEGMWGGNRAFIVGGGPSLGGFDFSKLENEIVVAVNKSWECGVADLVVTGDARWLNRCESAKRASRSLPLVFCRLKKEKNKLRQTTPAYFCPVAEERYWGRDLDEGTGTGDSGLRAANLAAILGAQQIYLLGFDMGAGRHGHWHEGYKWGSRGYANYVDRWRQTMTSGQVEAKIINLVVPGFASNLRSVPQQRVEKVIP